MEDKQFFEKLILLVQPHRLLYDKRDKRYFNILEKHKVWQKIAKECGKTEPECKHRWKLLRERYGKEIKKMEDSSGRYKEPWCFLESMDYLKRSLGPRRIRDNASSDDNAVSENHQDNSFSFSDNFNTNSRFHQKDISLTLADDEESMVSVSEFTRRSKRSEEDDGLEKLLEAAKTLTNAAAALTAPVPVPVEKPTLIGAQLKAMELLLEDLPLSLQDEFFGKMYSELMKLRSRARQENK